MLHADAACKIVHNRDASAHLISAMLLTNFLHLGFFKLLKPILSITKLITKKGGTSS